MKTLHRQAGLTLVELMVAMTISLLILAALVAVFVNTSRANREFAHANSMLESGRLALQVMENDIVHGGYWGGYVPSFDDQTLDTVPTDTPTLVPDPCLAYNPANWTTAYENSLLGVPVQTYDAATVCAAIIADHQLNTDVLVIRHAEACIPGGGSPNCDAAVAGRLYFQASQCAATPGYVLNTAGFTMLQRDCVTANDLRRFQSTIYYVRNYSVTPGDGIPTLMRSEFNLAGGVLEHQAPVPLIEGIEGFRVELGIDDVSETGGAVDYSVAVNWADPDTRTSATNRGDGVPDGNFVRCTTLAPCTVDQLMNTTAVKLYVLARSREAAQGWTDTKTYALGTGTTLGPYNDTFRRHVFVNTIRLPNISGRRITP